MSNSFEPEELEHRLGKNSREIEQLLHDWAGIGLQQLSELLKREHARTQLAQQATRDINQDNISKPGQQAWPNPQVELTTMSNNSSHQHSEQLLFDIGQANTPFGQAFISTSAKGLNNLEFETATLDYQTWAAKLAKLHPGAALRHNNATANQIIRQIFDTETGVTNSLTLHLLGTPFQHSVWRAISTIPAGQVLSYGMVASSMNMPSASRAVGSAIAQNSIAFLIPCHRVIPSTGELGQYRWHSTRKKAMYIWEQSLLNKIQACSS